MRKIIKTLITLGMVGAMLFGAASCAAEQGSTTATSANTSGTTGSPATTAGATAATTAKPLSGKIVASGSTSMEELMTALGEAFTVINPGVSVEIQGGGSGTGIKNAMDGVTEIGNSSRALNSEEKTAGLNEHIIAIDGIAIVVNPANTVKALTSAQIAEIFTGKITNWKDVGGQDGTIVVVIRESGSGTRDGFESLLNIKDKSVETQVVNETGIVKSTVAGNALAIGYMSLGKVDTTVTALSVDGIAATEANVKNKSYILQRPFLCLTKGSEPDLVKAFFAFIYSDEGQAMVAKKGFVTVK
jgi:phosphate transport system substrate-binding protein